MPLHAGDVFAGYTIQRLLGAGGMGEVYLAQHPRLPRHDALKILPGSLTGDTQYRERFNREADIAASLWHPHIVSLHDRGEADGQLWLAMDYVDGTDASRLLREQYPAGLPVHEASEIVTAIADALDYAHDRHLLHRDVKPANILLTRPDAARRRILLADFGVARRTDDISGLTATNMTVGSMPYSAPEQLLGQSLDGRADQYALAASAFQMLTGRSPFHHSNPAVIISKHLSEAPPQLRDSHANLGHLDAVISRALAKEPVDRYPRCSDFAQALADAATQPVERPQPSSPPPAAAPPMSAPPPVFNSQAAARTVSAPSVTARAVNAPSVNIPPVSTGWSSPAIQAGQKPQKRSIATVLVPAILAVLLACAIGFAVSQFARSTPTAAPAPQWQPYVDAAKTVAQDLVSVSADSVDADIERVLDGTTGDFHDKFADGAPELKRKTLADGTNTEATVTGAGIQTFDSGEAAVLVSVTTKTTDNSNAPRQDAVQRIAITMVNVDNGYKASTAEFIE